MTYDPNRTRIDKPVSYQPERDKMNISLLVAGLPSPLPLVRFGTTSKAHLRSRPLIALMFIHQQRPASDRHRNVNRANTPIRLLTLQRR